MKTRFSILMTAALAALALTASAAPVSYSFIPQGYSLQVSNLNLGITNTSSLISQGGVGWGTNIVGSLWTNNFGTRVLAVNTNVSTQYGAAYAVNDDGTMLIGDVDNPALNRAPLVYTVGGAEVNTNFTAFNISGRLVGVNAAANSAVNFRFVSLPDGVNETTGETYTVAVTANGTTPVVWRSEVPVGVFGNARKIRLKSIDNADETANSAVWVTAITLNGYSP